MPFLVMSCLSSYERNIPWIEGISKLNFRRAWNLFVELLLVEIQHQVTLKDRFEKTWYPMKLYLTYSSRLCVDSVMTQISSRNFNSLSDNLANSNSCLEDTCFQLRTIWLLRKNVLDLIDNALSHTSETPDIIIMNRYETRDFVSSLIKKNSTYFPKATLSYM